MAEATTNGMVPDVAHVLQRPQQMVKRTIVVPRVDNDGASLDAEIVRIELELLRLTSAFTVHISASVWASPLGVIYRDPSMTYMIVSDPVTDAKLAERLPEWAGWLRQEGLYTDSIVAQVAVVERTQAGER